LLEVKSVQLQQLQASSTQQIKSLEERLEQEETTVTGLRQELTDKEQQLQTATQSHNDVCCILRQPLVVLIVCILDLVWFPISK